MSGSTVGGDPKTQPDPATRLYEEAEASSAKMMERIVGSGGFSGLLGQVAENTIAASKLASDAFDLVLRNLRLASRRDLVRLGTQLARTEDKLEQVLQEIEKLHDDVNERPPTPKPPSGAPRKSGRTRARKPTR